MNSSPAQLLFVYGTLKRGCSNRHWLEGAGWRGRARLARHNLHSLGDYPMAVPGRGVVHGEVYAVDDAALERLDRLEDVPNEYQRRICGLEDGRQAWVYVGKASQVQGRHRVPYGDWQSRPTRLSMIETKISMTIYPSCMITWQSRLAQAELKN